MSPPVVLNKVNDWTASKIRVDRFCVDIGLIVTRDSSARLVWFPSSSLNQEMDGNGIPMAVQLKVTAVGSMVTYDVLEIIAIGATGGRRTQTELI